MNGVTLVVVSPLKGFKLTSGSIMLTQKFVDGMTLYREFWKGPILLLCEPADQPSNNLDNIELGTADFQTQCAILTDDFLRSALPNRSLVLSSVGEQFNKVSRICREKGLPCVYITEYTLQTRLQIIDAYQTSLSRRAWAKLRQVKQEFAQRRAIANSAGVQCNGLPTYESYKRINPNPHLFFDNRVEERMLATPLLIEQRISHMKSTKKLRLLFSGRLDLMKGVSDLPIIADHLRDFKIPFAMSICGDGEFAADLRNQIHTRGLSELVTMEGTLEFKSKLVPFVTERADLFVCCHPQGDPSCTYIETMSCGVPIVGYANEALSSLVKYSGVGWSTPVGDPLLLAKQIEAIYKDLERLGISAHRSVEFASKHTFETTFAKRIQHLDSIAEPIFAQRTAAASSG